MTTCKVCHARIDGFGDIEHGKGCYAYRAEGGGIEYVGLAEPGFQLLPPTTGNVFSGFATAGESLSASLEEHRAKVLRLAQDGMISMDGVDERTNGELRDLDRRVRFDKIDSYVRRIDNMTRELVVMATNANEHAEHDMLQDALSALDVVRQLVDRARSARSGGG